MYAATKRASEMRSRKRGSNSIVLNENKAKQFQERPIKYIRLPCHAHLLFALRQIISQ